MVKRIDVSVQSKCTVAGLYRLEVVIRIRLALVCTAVHSRAATVTIVGAAVIRW
jgi:hypothetical protein